MNANGNLQSGPPRISPSTGPSTDTSTSTDSGEGQPAGTPQQVTGAYLTDGPSASPPATLPPATFPQTAAPAFQAAQPQPSYAAAAGNGTGQAYVCADPSSYQGQQFGDARSLNFVRQSASAPAPSQWVEGPPVKGTDAAPGTAIAVFDATGPDPSVATARHAAIYHGRDASGIWIWDQWRGHPVGLRHVQFNGGAGSPIDDADAYSLIQQCVSMNRTK